MAEPHASGPLCVADLDFAEQHGFGLAHDTATGGAALASFESWFQVLATHCSRDLYLHRAPCPCLSADERAMLDLVASAQAADEMRLHDIAAGLVHPRAIERLQKSSRSFAAALCRLSLRLPDRPRRAWGSGPGLPN